jgi:hypothetical protein
MPAAMLVNGRHLPLAASPDGLATTLNPLSDSRWQSTVLDANASFFHGDVWAKILAETYGFSPCYLRAENSGDAQLLPVMEANSFISGRRGIALPFTDECEAIATDSTGFNVLFSTALTHLQTRRWKYFELRGGETELRGAPTAAEFWGHEVPLQGRSPAELFAGCSSPTRRAVRKAEKNGVVVEFSRTWEGMNAFYSLFCQTRKRHGNPPQPIKFFREIHRHAIEGNAGHLLLAKHGNAVVAGAIFLHQGRSAIYKFGASDASFRHLAANNLVMWRALQWYAEQGFAHLRLGRTSLDNDGLRQFKLGWGAREYSIKYFRYSRKARDFVPGVDQSSGWQTRIFKLLPQRVSRPLGALAYRHIA